MKNYIRIKKLSLRKAYYMFVDHKDYIADSLFIRNKCHVDFLNEYAHKECDWIVIFCSVEKKDIALFEAAMDEMENAALLKGYTDYIDSINRFWKPIMEKET